MADLMDFMDALKSMDTNDSDLLPEGTQGPSVSDLEPENDPMSKEYIPKPSVTDEDIEREEERQVTDVAKSFAGGAVSAGTSGLRGLEWMTGSEMFGDLAKPIEDVAEEYLTPERQNIINDIASGAGSMLSFMLPGLGVSRAFSVINKAAEVSRLTMIAAEVSGIAVHSAMEATAEAGSVAKTLKDQGKSEEEINSAAMKSFAANMLLLMGTDKLTGFFNAFKGAGKKYWGEVAKGVVGEGTQEAGQQVIEQKTTGRAVDLKEAAYAGLIGGLLGGVVGGGIHGIDNRLNTEVAEDAQGNLKEGVDENGNPVEPTKTVDGFDPNAEIDLSDSDSFNRGMDKNNTEDADNDVEITNLINETQKEVLQNKKEEEQYKQDQADKAALEEQNRQAELKAAEDKKNQNIQETNFQIALSTKAGTMDKASELIAPVESQGTSEEKKMVKPLRNAHKAIYRGNLTEDKVKDLQYDLDEVIKTTDNKELGMVAGSLKNILSTDLKEQQRLERAQEAAKRNIQQTDQSSQQKSDRTVEVAQKTAEKKTLKEQGQRLRQEYAAKKTTYQAPSVLNEQTEEQKRNIRKKNIAKKNIEQTDKASVTPKPKETTVSAPKVNRLKLAQETIARQKQAKINAAKRNLNVLSKGKGTAKTLRLSKGSSQSLKVAEQVNKETPGIVKYDGDWGNGMHQFTTQKAIGTMKAGQTFVVQGKDLNPQGVRNAIQRKVKQFESYQKNPAKALEKGRLQTKTKAFKKWFGKSTIADKNGPKVVYHGTRGNFSTFEKGDIGFHVGTANQANDRLRQTEEQAGKSKVDQNIMPLFAKIENPLRMKDVGGWTSAHNIIDELERTKAITQDQARSYEDKFNSALESGESIRDSNKEVIDVIKSDLQKMGYDGIVYENEHEGKELFGKDSYIVFNPNQLKSAIGNEGTFSETNPDIRKSKGTTVSKSSPEFHNEVKKIITDMNSTTGVRGVKLKIVKSADQVSIKENGKEVKLSKTDRGARYGNTVYMFTDNLESVADAITLYMHEAIGHGGLEKFCKDHKMDYNKLMLDVHDSLNNNSMFKEVATLYDSEVKRLGLEGDAKKIYLAEEFMAHRAEKVDPFTKRKLWMKIRDFINNWLTKTFKLENVKISLKDADLLLKASSQYMFTGKIRQNLEFANPTKTYADNVEEVLKTQSRALAWYKNHQELVSKHFGKDAGLFNVLLALTSPGALVKTNAKWAVETYLYLDGKLNIAKSRFPNEMMKKLERIADKIPAYDIKQVETTSGKKERVITKREKLERKYASGKFYNESVKTNQFKVAEFIRALLGDNRATVHDRWMYRILYGPSLLNNTFLQKIENGEVGEGDLDAGWSKPENFAARHKLFDITRELNKRGHNVSPSEVQAALWVREVQLTEGNKALSDYEEGLQAPSVDLGGLTPLEYLEKMRGPEKSAPVSDKLKLGKLNERSQLDVEYNNWLKKEGIKPINIKGKYPALNPEYFADGNPKSLSIDGSEISKVEFTGGKKNESILKTKPFAIVTAENPNDTSLSEKENIKRNKELAKFMDDKGYDYTPIEGYYNRHEDSFLVFGLDRDQSLEIAKKFDQESVVHNGDLVYQDGTYNPGDLDKIDFSGKQTNFFSTALIKGKEVKFSIPIDFDNRVMNIIHYSPVQDLKVVDPEFLGKGQIGAERSEIKDWNTMELFPGFEKKSNWYVPKDSKKIEGHRFGMLPVYEATINLEEVYIHDPRAVEPMPEELKGSKAAKVFRDAAIKAQTKPSDTELRELGYKGWYDATTGQVRMFEKVPVKYLGRSRVTRKDFNNVTGKNFKQFIVKDDKVDQTVSDMKVRFSKSKELNIKPEDALKIDQELLLADKLGEQSMVNRLYEFIDDSVHEGEVEILKLQKELYSMLGKKGRDTSTDLTQKALHLYLDTRGTGTALKDYYSKIKKEVKNATGDAKARLLHQIDVIERMGKLTPEMRKWADTRLRGYYDSVYEQAKEGGIINSFVEDYSRRIWKAPEDIDESLWANWGATNKRTLGSIIEGWDRGMDLRVEGALPILQEYSREMMTKVAQKTFKNYGLNLQNLNGIPMFIPENKAVSFVDENGDKVEKDPREIGYAPLKSPAFSVWLPEGWIYAKGKGSELVITKESFKDVLFARPGDSKKTAIPYAKHQLWAPKEIADLLNRQYRSDKDMFEQSAALDFLLKLNGRMKSSILSISPFHYIAGARSWYFGVHGGSKNVFTAQKQGMEKILAMNPILKLGVRNGLTIGAVQDFDERMIQDSRNFMMWIGDKTNTKFVKDFGKWGRLQREKFTNAMFGKWFAGLKAEAFFIEYSHALKRAEKQVLAGKMDEVNVDEIAKEVAKLINDDFGGLHNKRLNKSPSIMKAARLFLLAPDWTFSNFRTVGGALGLNRIIQKVSSGHVTQSKELDRLHRRFWMGAIWKVALLSSLSTAMIYGLFGDDDDSVVEHYKDQFSSWDQFSKFKWAYTDITPLLKRLGAKPEHKVGLSVGGHFLDPLKLSNPWQLIKGKVSPVGRVGEQIMTGSDWADRPFTSVTELAKTGKTVQKSRHNPKAGPFSRLPSVFINTLQNSQPVALQQLLGYLQGEEEGYIALGRAAGLHVPAIYSSREDEKQFSLINSRINKIEKKYKQAKKIGDKKGLADAVQDIRDYKGYRTIKKLLGTYKKKLKPINAKIKLIEKIKGVRNLSKAQEDALEKLKKTKKELHLRFMDQYNKIRSKYR